MTVQSGRQPSLQEVFGVGGLLAKTVVDYCHRQAQLEMGLAVETAMAARGTLIAEAGTGTGKTFAYLVPAILSGCKVIVSTGTKNLQDQLYRKDLPVVRQALAFGFQAALLKGRSNYLCLYRLKNVMAFRASHTRSDLADIETIKRWAQTTVSGDVAEVTEVAESSPLWASVTSTLDNCLGQDCPDFAECHLVKARRKAQEAQIVIINHHLLWADWALKQDGFGELLPQAEVIIVDEAHQFADTATQFLGLAVSSRQFFELADDTVVEQLKDARDQTELTAIAEKLEVVVSEMRLALGMEARREAWSAVEHNSELMASVEALREQLNTLSAALKPAAVRGKGLESCWKRCEDLRLKLASFLENESNDAVRWFETHKRSFSLNRTPLDIAGEFAAFHKASASAWIFTSATLSVGDQFGHFANALGLNAAEQRQWDSPFDYDAQSLLYVPQNLPEPATPQYTIAVVEAALPVLKASEGRAFLLFTSHQAMQTAANALSSLVDYPLFIQGTQPKAALLEAFRLAGNGVLLGTASFWEGVDVRGPALSCVIIDKLPFASPGDPVLSARLDTLKQRGINPFLSHQLPSAVIALKQGVGRLIRSNEDRGVLMLCDPRIISKPYGKVFLRSLPPMRRTRSLSKVVDFMVELSHQPTHPNRAEFSA